MDQIKENLQFPAVVGGNCGDGGRIYFATDDAVKAGDDHILRDLQPMLKQDIAGRNSHGVVRTDNGVRQLGIL